MTAAGPVPPLPGGVNCRTVWAWCPGRLPPSGGVRVGVAVRDRGEPVAEEDTQKSMIFPPLA
ncbi:hypothetical protein GCM10010255_63580 [Streptomyces coeruleofuscus]|uniref:Uncharacterized protein n=1 Tax=Streptomyces coeruleofuscus TaxID=66879 RepID=A0ABP5W063_9ACTN